MGDLDEINDIKNERNKNKPLAIEDKKAASESLAKRFNRSFTDAIELYDPAKAQKKKDHTKSDSEDEKEDFWKSECISRKRNLSLNSAGDAVVNIADPSQRQALAIKDKEEDGVLA